MEVALPILAFRPGSRLHATPAHDGTGGVAVHTHGKTKLGFFPLPVGEAKRLSKHLSFSSEFSAVDPCVGDGAAFSALVEGTPAKRYGVEIDAYRSAQARTLCIEVLQANAMDVRSNVESVSLLYLNPPYDWNQAKRTTSAWSLFFWSTPIA